MDYTKATRASIDAEQIKLSAANQLLEDFLNEQRETFEKMICPLYEQISRNDPKELMELQYLTLSLRQKVTDDITIYLNRISKYMPDLKRYKGDRFEFYATNFGLKTNQNEKKEMIDRDLAENERKIELLQTHVEWLRECKYACDQIAFAVKNRIELLKWQLTVN
jgi:hypothetical protein